jgi:Mrp family chromosome partitioning ATPase
LVLGFGIAVAGAVGLAFLAEYFDHSLQTCEDDAQNLALPVVGSIPLLRHRQLFTSRRAQGTIAPTKDRDHPAGDLAARLPWDVREECLSVLHRFALQPRDAAGARRHWGITSCTSGEGASTVALQLALAAASSGNDPVLLVDANFTRPSLDRVFGVSRGPGLAEVLLAAQPASEVIRSTATANLSLLTAGTACEELAERCDLADLTALLCSLPQDFRLVVFDLPSAGRRSLLVRLARGLEGVLLVVGAEGISGELAGGTERLLHESGLPLLGVLLNKTRSYVPSWLRRP